MSALNDTHSGHFCSNNWVCSVPVERGMAREAGWEVSLALDEESRTPASPSPSPEHGLSSCALQDPFLKLGLETFQISAKGSVHKFGGRDQGSCQAQTQLYPGCHPALPKAL